MGKFCHLSPELWPLIDVKSSFPLSILSIFWQIFFKLYIRVDIRKDVVWDCRWVNFVN